MRYRTLLMALAALAVAGSGQAQVGNQTDIGFPGPITGSGALGGSYLGAGLRTMNELFARVGDQVVFRTPRLGCALRGAERAYRDSMATVAQTAAQRRVLELLAVNAGTPSADAVARALAPHADPASPLGQAAHALANALDGLMKDQGGCGDARADYAEAGQWQQAIEAFQQFIHDAPVEVFAPPAPELIAIHDALQRVIGATLSDRAAR
jgi:hypothetical protein